MDGFRELASGGGLGILGLWFALTLGMLIAVMVAGGGREAACLTAACCCLTLLFAV
ncbi:MAG: hypothetical protein AAF371_17400 [Pseudomonadota bacterium]